MVSTDSLNGLEILMLVANDVTVDSRVKKMAKTVAGTGAAVTVLGISPEGKPQSTRMGEVTVHLIPVGDELRTAPRSRWLPLLAPSDDWLRRAIVAEREGFRNRQRETGARLGWLRRDFFEQRSKSRELASQPSDPTDPPRSSGRRGNRGLRRRLPWGVQRRLAALEERRAERRAIAREDRAERRFRRQEERLTATLVAAQARSEHRLEILKRRLVSGGGLQPSGWRRALPGQRDLEAAFGPRIDEMSPDIVHVHDVHLLGVATRAAGRAYSRKLAPRLIYDAHEYIRGLGTYRPSTVAAWADLEEEYMSRVDRVVTVSDQLAALLSRDYDLDPPPTVVLNIPEPPEPCPTSLRAATGLSDDHELVVYSGGIDPTRGTEVLIDALGLMDGIHLVIVTNSTGRYREGLIERAEERGGAERLHFVPFVPSEQVSSYIADADAAVHPMLAGPINHEVALPNKLFEYMLAGLPVAVSSCEAMAGLVRETGIGLSFASGDPGALASSVSQLLENRESFRSAYTRLAGQFSWEEQANTLLSVYSELAR